MSNKGYFYVGIVSFLLFAGIFSLVLWKNSIFTRVKSYQLIGEFTSISGLLENAVVKYRGYPIGRVTQIIPDQKSIYVYFFVDSKYNIPKGSEVKIVFDGLVGEKYMEILPNKTSQTFYKNGDIISGYSSSGLSDFIEVGTKNLEELQVVIESISTVFGDREVASAMRDLVFSLKKAVNNMDEMIDNLSDIAASEKLKNIMSQVEVLLTGINGAISKEEYEKIAKIIKNFELFSEDLKNLTNDNELKTAMISTLKETHSTFQQSSSFLQTISRIELLTGVDFNYKFNSPDRDFLIYQMNFNFWLDNAYLNFGFSNYFDHDKLTHVLLNLPFNESTRFYYGLIRSSPGFGIKHHFPYTHLSTSFNMYNFESPFFDIGIHYKVLNQLFMNLGYFELNKPSRAAFIGLSIHGHDQ
jgi:phospholipid/cholesterol/gamma-HCH transport system substrate-binding protein